LPKGGEVALTRPEGGPCLGVKADYAFLQDALHRVLEVPMPRDDVYRTIIAPHRQRAHLLPRDPSNRFRWRCDGGIPIHTPHTRPVPRGGWALARPWVPSLRATSRQALRCERPVPLSCD